MRRVLIVGGTGFLGYHLAKKLIANNYSIVSLSRKRPKKIRFLKNVKYILVNISEKKKLLKVINKIKNVKYVVNFGGEVNHSKKKETFETHFRGLKNLVYFYRKKNLIKFIQIGSSLEYGRSNSPQNENYSLKPRSYYSRAKALSTNFLISSFKKKKFPFIVVRPYQIYGPNQDINRLIPITIKNCLANKKFPCSSGIQLRDFLYVDDFIRAISILLVKKNLVGHVFNIGAGKPKKVKNIINFIQKKINKGKPDFGKIKLRYDENIVTYPNIKKIKRAINWSPKISLCEGLIKTINFYKKVLK